MLDDNQYIKRLIDVIKCLETRESSLHSFIMAMEALMERIRFKQTSENNQKSLGDTSKIVRMNMADRRHSLDTTDKSILR